MKNRTVPLFPMGEQIVLDLETQKGFHEVDGRENFHLLKVSLCGIYSYQKDQYLTFTEDRLKELEPILSSSERIIGFNINRFDFPVLQPYLSIDLSRLPHLDMLEEVVRTLGHRLKLNSIASNTLGLGKSGSGLDALRYFREGRWDLLERYCKDDVRITRDIYEYGKTNGYILYHNGMEVAKIPVDWAQGQSTVPERVRSAYRSTVRLVIEYPTTDEHGEMASLKRKIEIYYIKDDLIAAFCFLRNQPRTFRLSRILDAQLTQEPYSIPSDFNPSEWEASLRR